MVGGVSVCSASDNGGGRDCCSTSRRDGNISTNLAPWSRHAHQAWLRSPSREAAPWGQSAVNESQDPAAGIAPLRLEPAAYFRPRCCRSRRGRPWLFPHGQVVSCKRETIGVNKVRSTKYKRTKYCPAGSSAGTPLARENVGLGSLTTPLLASLSQPDFSQHSFIFIDHAPSPRATDSASSLGEHRRPAARVLAPSLGEPDCSQPIDPPGRAVWVTVAIPGAARTSDLCQPYDPDQKVPLTTNVASF